MIDADKARARFENRKKRGEAVRRQYCDIATVNESFYAGDQWSALLTHGGHVAIERDAWFDKEGIPRISGNLFTGLHQTWSALLSRGKPTVRAVAASNEPEDTYRAEVGQSVIEFLQRELNTGEKTSVAVQTMASGGTAILKVFYVPPRDGKPGGVHWTVCSVHDALLDPSAENDEDARWVAFQSYVSTEEADEELRAAGIEVEASDLEGLETSYRNGANETLMGVERWELWEMPSREYPKGLYMCIVGTHVVEAIDNPHVFPTADGGEEYCLPSIVMRARRQRGSAYGRTNFTDIVPLQRAYNENISRTQKAVRKSNALHLLYPAELPDMKTEDDNIIRFPMAKAMAAKAIGYVQPAPIDRTLLELRDFFAVLMEKVVGLNSVTTGSQPRSLSGRAIDNLVELDQDRNADAIESLNSGIERAWRLTLKLVQRYYTEPMVMRIAGADAMTAMSFMGSDIAGVDVAIEYGSEVDTLSQRKEEIQGERVANGLAGPLDLQKAQRAPQLGNAIASAEMLFEQFKATGGQLVEAPDDITPEAVAEVVSRLKARAVSMGDQGLYVLAVRFAKAVEQLLTQAADVNPAMPEAEQAPGAPVTPQPIQ